jgi:pimeloyl-ACP methyl ester carboxylesterase
VTVGSVRRAGLAACALLLLGACSDVRRAVEPKTTVSDGVRQVRLDKATEVEVDGRRVATRCGGGKSGPSVLLVAGFDTPLAAAWDPVQAGIGAFARVCAYDRLGVGGSGKPPKSQTFEDMAQTLDGVVTELKLERPVVLVAHSLGGMVAATWAAEHPKDAAGIVMVDATGPGYPQRLLDLLPRSGRSAGAQLRDGYESLLRPARNAEHLDGRQAFRQVEELAPIVGVPMTLLTHSVIDLGDVRPQVAADLESFWEEGQNRWLRLASQARVERVDLAGHAIQKDRPDVVIERIRELVDD